MKSLPSGHAALCSRVSGLPPSLPPLSIILSNVAAVDVVAGCCRRRRRRRRRRRLFLRWPESSALLFKSRARL